MRRRFFYLFAVTAAFATTGCPGGGSTSGGISSECTKLEAQCQLKDGVLGVCSEVACPAGQSPPCLTCMAQH